MKYRHIFVPFEEIERKQINFVYKGVLYWIADPNQGVLFVTHGEKGKIYWPQFNSDVNVSRQVHDKLYGKYDNLTISPVDSFLRDGWNLNYDYYRKWDPLFPGDKK